MKDRIKHSEIHREEEANGTLEEIEEKFNQNIWILMPQ